MRFPYISSFAADVQWRLDLHWRFWIIHVVSQNNSILTSSSPLGLEISLIKIHVIVSLSVEIIIFFEINIVVV